MLDIENPGAIGALSKIILPYSPLYIAEKTDQTP